MDEKLELIGKFNAELVAIAKTGLPIELGMGETPQTLEQLLRDSANRIAATTRTGQTLETALAAEPALSETYRTALNAWLYGNLPTSSLDALTEPATLRKRKQSTLQLALVQPIVIASVAYVAMIFLCTVSLRSYQRLDAQFIEPSSWSVAILSGFATAMWFWVPAVPIFIVVLIVRSYLLTSAPRPLSNSAANKAANSAGRPASYRSADRVEQAAVADRVADYVENQIPLAEALRLAGAGSFAIAAVAAVPAEGEQLTAPTLELSPLMRWATAEDRSRESQVSALRFVARTYRQLAALRTQRSLRWLPVILSATIGGVIVLGVALTVFGPPIEFLLRISQGDR